MTREEALQKIEELKQYIEKPNKPSKYDTYWYINTNKMEIYGETWFDDSIDIMLYDKHLVFKTYEEAEEVLYFFKYIDEHIDKTKWNDNNIHYRIVYNYEYDDLSVFGNSAIKVTKYHFSEDVANYIVNNYADFYKLYILGMEE